MHIPYRIKRSAWLVRQWFLGLTSKVHGVPPLKTPDGVERVGFYPAFRSQTEVVDALQKIRYFIDPSRVASVEISLDCALDFDLEDSASWPVPDYNCAIAPGETTRVTVAARPVGLWRALAKYDRVFVWDWTFDEHPRPWAQASGKLLNVDRHRYGSEAWSWSEFAYATRKDGDATAQARRSVERFKAHIEQLPAFKKAYVFGTGPSLDRAMEMDFSDGYRIVCNTIVENEALLTHIDPHIIVAGDAVYHYAPNVHASAFRRDLEKALRNSNMLFVTRDLYLPLLQRHHPEVAERTVTAESGVPAETHPARATPISPTGQSRHLPARRRCQTLR